jgi:hypothetical protein
MPNQTDAHETIQPSQAEPSHRTSCRRILWKTFQTDTDAQQLCQQGEMIPAGFTRTKEYDKVF